MNSIIPHHSSDFTPTVTEPSYSPQRSNESNAVVKLIASTLRLWWVYALVLGVLAATGAAALVLMTFETEYKASMWLRIYTDAPYIVFQEKGGSGQFVENQTHLIRSRLVLGALFSDPKIANLKELEQSVDKIDALADRLVVNPVGKSEYFAVEYRGIDKEISKHVVQQVVDSYMLLQNSDEVRQRQDVMSLLDSEKAIREQKVEELRKALSQLVENSSVVERGKSDFTKEQLSELADLRKRLVTVDVEGSILKIEFQAFKNSNEKMSFKPPMEKIKLEVEQNEQIVWIERNIERLQSEIKELRYGKDHYTSKQLRNELVSLNARLASTQEKITEQIETRLRLEWSGENDKKLQAMKSRLASYEITRDVIDTHINENTGAIKKMTGDSLQVEFLRAELGQATEVHDLISSRLLALKTEQRAPSRVQPLESGGLTAIPTELVPYKKLALASTSAFAFPFLLFFALESCLQRVSNSRQLEESGELHVIGEIANLPDAQLMRRLRPKRWAVENHVYRESVDQLRTCLVCLEKDQNAQVTAVVSAVSGEGKTSLATQMAISLASSTGRRVLLIDGDLRIPNIHERFESDLSPGLSDVLENSISWKKAIAKKKPGGPYILSAGELSSSPQRLFGGNEFKHLMERVRRDFRYIVIDTPPVLAASESLVMSKAADLVLFCVRRDRSRLANVQAAHERLHVAGIHSVGTVLTGIPHQRYSAKYGVYKHAESKKNKRRAVRLV